MMDSLLLQVKATLAPPPLFSTREVKLEEGGCLSIRIGTLQRGAVDINQMPSLSTTAFDLVKCRR